MTKTKSQKHAKQAKTAAHNHQHRHHANSHTHHAKLSPPPLPKKNFLYRLFSNINIKDSQIFIFLIAIVGIIALLLIFSSIEGAFNKTGMAFLPETTNFGAPNSPAISTSGLATLPTLPYQIYGAVTNNGQQAQQGTVSAKLNNQEIGRTSVIAGKYGFDDIFLVQIPGSLLQGLTEFQVDLFLDGTLAGNIIFKTSDAGSARKADLVVGAKPATQSTATSTPSSTPSATSTITPTATSTPISVQTSTSTQTTAKTTSTPQSSSSTPVQVAASYQSTPITVVTQTPYSPAPVVQTPVIMATQQVCQPVWSCNYWSTCINGEQTRVCSDMMCGLTVRTETQACQVQQPAVSAQESKSQVSTTAKQTSTAQAASSIDPRLEKPANVAVSPKAISSNYLKIILPIALVVIVLCIISLALLKRKPNQFTTGTNEPSVKQAEQLFEENNLSSDISEKESRQPENTYPAGAHAAPSITLDAYVAKELSKGFKEEEVKQALKNVGWQEKYIEQAFSKAKSAELDSQNKDAQNAGEKQ